MYRENEGEKNEDIPLRPHRARYWSQSLLSLHNIAELSRNFITARWVEAKRREGSGVRGEPASGRQLLVDRCARGVGASVRRRAGPSAK